MRNICFAILTFILMAKLAHGYSADLGQVLNSSFGMVNVSLTETESQLESDDEDTTSEAAASSAAVTSFELNYEFKNEEKRSYFLKANVPLMSSSGSGLFLGGIGVNFFLNPISSVYSLADEGSTLRLVPKFRYYWGASTGVGYLIYNTETAKKSDVFFDLGVHAGGVYNISKKWGIRGELGFSRGTGAATTSTGMKFFLGASYYL